MSAPSRLWHSLFALERTAVVPLLRVVMVLWLIVMRFDGMGRHVRAALDKHPLEVLHAPHVAAFLGVFGAWPMPTALVDALEPILIGAGLCAVIGVFTRVALAVCFAAFCCSYGVVTGYGFFNHTPALPAQVLLALAVLPGVTSFSVDRLLLALWRRRRGDPRPLLDTIWPAVPRFGEVGVCFVVGLVYAAAGIAKLRLGAADWMNGETLRWYLEGGAKKVQYWYGARGTGRIDGHLYMGHGTRLGTALASSTAAMLLLSWLTLCTELFAPLFLVRGGWHRVGFVVVAVAFHVGIVVTLGPRFLDWMVVDVCLVLPFLVERGRDALSRRRAR